jgi:hypothetical protein
MNNKLKQEHSDIIEKSKNMAPENYDRINFKEYLFRTLSIKNRFIDWETFARLREKLNIDFHNENSCFKEFGELALVNFAELYYYQLEVGISGSKHTKLNDPLFILRAENMLILWNGYHRVVEMIFNRKYSAKAFILEM